LCISVVVAPNLIRYVLPEPKGRGGPDEWIGRAYVTGVVDQELLARIEYLAAENRILKSHSKGRLQLSDAERATLGELGHRLGRKALAEVATVARPDTILAWYRKMVARKFDGSQARRGPGRPRISRKVERLIVRMAKENRDWGYDRIVGALANLGYEVCDQTVGNVLQRHGLPPAPERKRTTSWPTFIRTHLVLLAGTDFFTAMRTISRSTFRLIRGRPGPRRACEPSNLRATILRYQARIVSGRATFATSARALRPRR